MPHLRGLRAGASLIDVFKAFPQISAPLIEFHEVLLRGPSPFTGAERELIAAYVSGLNRCRYCHGVHTATAELMGVEAGLVQGLVRAEDLEAAPAMQCARCELRGSGFTAPRGAWLPAVARIDETF